MQTRFWSIFVALAFCIHVSAQEVQKSPGLAYLLDDAIRIYVVDESRCSANPNSKEGGQWYLIEGAETLSRLRSELARVDLNNQGGCMCGGPDIHFYAETGGGETTYFGLDCEEYLAGIQISASLQKEMNPSKPGFVGRRVGQTYIVDIPFEVEEPLAHKRFSEASLQLMVGGWTNMATGARPRAYFVKKYRKETAPALVRLELGPFSPKRPSPHRLKNPTPEQEESLDARFQEWYFENDKYQREVAGELMNRWLDRTGLADALSLPPSLTFSDSKGDRSTYQAELYFNSAEIVKTTLASPKAALKGTHLADIEYRPQGLSKAPEFYQAALLLSDSPTPMDIAKAKAVMPGIGRVVPLCECTERPRG